MYSLLLAKQYSVDDLILSFIFFLTEYGKDPFFNCKVAKQADNTVALSEFASCTYKLCLGYLEFRYCDWHFTTYVVALGTSKSGGPRM